jgi:hypothetical protein
VALRVVLALMCVAACDGATREQLERRSASQPSASTVPDRAPLRTWMQAELVHRLKQADFDGLARSLDALAALRPPDLDRWEELARDGARAAAARDLEAVRRACMDCHQVYRTRYRERLRLRPIGALKGNS